MGGAVCALDAVVGREATSRPDAGLFCEFSPTKSLEVSLSPKRHCD